MATEIGEHWQEIATQLCEKYEVAFEHIQLDKVLFLSETEKAPKKYADTRLVKFPFDFLTDYRYIITFYENNIQAMTDAQKIILVFHELLHIDESFEKIKKHNIEDFRELIGKFGCNWDIDPNLPNILADDYEDDDNEW